MVKVNQEQTNQEKEKEDGEFIEPKELPDIIFVNSGIANRFSTFIEINRNLPKYPRLYNQVLKHELSHTDSFFSLEDLKVDLSNQELSSWEMSKFIAKHPAALKQLLPIYFSKKNGVVYDLNLIIMYIILLVFIGVGVLI